MTGEQRFQQIRKFLSEHNVQSEDELEKLIEEFIKNTDTSESEPLEFDSYDYMEMAQKAKTKKMAIQYAQKALELDPNFLDASVFLAELQIKDEEKLQKKYEELLVKGEQYLNEQGITLEKNAGEFYDIFETRPYIRLRMSYADLLNFLGKRKKAAKEFEEILRLCPNDNMGARYILMAIYASFEDEENLLRLYKMYEEEKGAFFLLPIVAYYYTQDDQEKAAEYFYEICSKNKEVRKALSILSKDGMEMIEISRHNYYSPYTCEEFVLAYTDNIFLYSGIPYFIKWLKSIPNKRKTINKPNPKQQPLTP